ncbi:MAG: ABC transporter ATP-binding protein [Polaromonas sp.]|nr:ABC transporter ATP-binding protein [Polaromonas sp.]
MQAQLSSVSDPAFLPASDRGGPAQPLLAVRNLVKHFPVRDPLWVRPRRAVHAVDGVSFEVAKGETLGVVGESGCGKSTTARLIARLLTPDSGSLVFDGEGVGEFSGLSLSDYRRSLQMVFQDSFASLNPRMTVEDTISFGPRVHGLSATQSRDMAHALLNRVGLQSAQFASRYPHELSGGQRQRINIARALALQPRLLVLDEAVAALDKSVQAQVLNLLQELKAENKLTYIFISHDLHVVQYLCDRVMVMYLGQVVEIGPVEQIYSAARHPYTRALLSAVPSMDPSRRTVQSPLAGDPPNPINPSAGCRFRDRCQHAEAVCAIASPALQALSQPGHQVACHMAIPGSGHSATPLVDTEAA